MPVPLLQNGYSIPASYGLARFRFRAKKAMILFFLIMLPIAKPGVVVATVFSFVYAWGDLIYGITFITNPNMRPITSSIYNYVQQYQTLWNSTMAFGIIAISPVVLIFIFMKRYIVSGLTNGAVKA